MSDVLKSVIEQAIQHRQFGAALDTLRTLTLAQLLYFEARSPAIERALRELNWFYFLFYFRYPLVAERHKDSARETWILVEKFPLLMTQKAQSLRKGRYVARAEQENGLPWSVAGKPYTLFRNNEALRVGPTRRQLYVAPCDRGAYALDDETLVYLAQNNRNFDALMYSSKVQLGDYSPHFWALNHGENPCVDAPETLMGDLWLVDVKVAASSSASIMAVALNREPKEDASIAFFDASKPALYPSYEGEVLCWYQLASAVVAPRDRITDIAFVLGGDLLLVATEWALLAIPRANPRSFYFVEENNNHIRYLVGRSNVLCIVTDGKLSVSRVLRQDVDPFVRFELLYEAYTAAFNVLKPFLVGPYVVYQSEDFEWVYANYEDDEGEPEEIPITLEKMAWGWKLQDILSCTLTHIGARIRSSVEDRTIDVILRVGE